MELFHENGHLTDEGLQALQKETLNEMQRLEVAEHLGFCDECLVRFTAQLNDETLLAPAEPLRPLMARRLRRAKGSSSRYITVAAAALLAVAMWGVGTFATSRSLLREKDSQTASLQSEKTDITGQNNFASRIDQALIGANNALNNIFNSYPQQAAASQQTDMSLNQEVPPQEKNLPSQATREEVFQKQSQQNKEEQDKSNTGKDSSGDAAAIAN